MGLFCGSVHVRKPVDDVEQTLRALAAERYVNLYVDPVSAGSPWIPIFPQHRGQDIDVAAAIAASLDGVVVHVLVHDSDEFAYAVYHAGRRVDDVSPALWADLLAPGQSVARIEAVVTRLRDRERRRDHRLLREGEQLADVLGRFDREVDELKRSSAAARAELDERLLKRTSDLLGKRPRSTADAIEQLVKTKSPVAMELVADHGAEWLRIVHDLSAPGGILARLDLGDLSAGEDALRDFAEALGLTRALLSYEDIAEQVATGNVDETSRHIAAAWRG